MTKHINVWSYFLICRRKLERKKDKKGIIKIMILIYR